ncbi:MAG TPA: glycosyltransferase, partial [Beijerinckiaceae bacterium]|nr:glycosyltransferase [Beijerinckiaceae bacterium]
GGMPVKLIDMAGLRSVQLPPVRTAGTDFRTLLDEDGRAIAPERLAMRRGRLLGALDELRPDVVVTELFPFGRRVLAQEFMALVERARALHPAPLILSSVRDILVAPARPDRIAEAHARLRAFYDGVLVHGDPGLVPLDASWPLDDGVRPLIRYTGYVDADPPVAASRGEPAAGGDIVVSGGSSAASMPLYRAATGAGSLLPAHRLRVLVGAGTPGEAFADLRDAAPGNVTVERARPDFRHLLAGAALSVSQSGYNTVIDVLRAGVGAVFVPFEAGHETEQRLRAERLQALGLAEIVAEAELSAATLADVMRRALQRRPGAAPPIRLDGAERSVAVVEELARQRGPARASTGRPFRWAALDSALAQLADAGTSVAFWWRDDDAVANTPQLGRLLALARRFELPIALAVIPRALQASLADRLADEPLAAVLVHGLSHVNHARPDEKKAEFGPHRSLDRLADDAAQGLAASRAGFAGRAVPVFVPPWNRVAPELPPLLPGLGFAGLSTFGDRQSSVPRLVHINTHIDPIDWRQGRGLRPPEALVAEVVRIVQARASGANRAGPIGLLTHHLVHDEATWAFCEELLGRLAAHSSVRFHTADAVFLRDNVVAGLS